LAFTLGSDRFDKGIAATPSESMVENTLATLGHIFMFPIMTLLNELPNDGPFHGLFGYIPLFFNSLIWALIIFYGYNWIRNKAGHRTV